MKELKFDNLYIIETFKHIFVILLKYEISETSSVLFLTSFYIVNITLYAPLLHSAYYSGISQT